MDAPINMGQANPVYPIKKTDYLDRPIYVDWNGIERTIYKYWDKTKKVKIKWRLFNQEASFDAYDKNGKNIISYSSGTLEINLPWVWADQQGEIGFKVDKSKLIRWRNISKSSVRKRHKTNQFFPPDWI